MSPTLPASLRDPAPVKIAHRGFAAQWPENSLAAHRHALLPLEADPADPADPAAGGGADALETDIHLTRDGVVVLSHDGTLRRCFGRPDRLADLDWADLAPLRTVQPPHEPMARLADLLALLAEPAHARAWVLLDVKRDDDPEVLLRRVAETVASVPGDWTDRIVLGCWEPKAMLACQHHLAGFPVAYIGFSLTCAEALLAHHADAVQVFNLNQNLLLGRRGARFQRAAQATGQHRVLAWTVNAPEWMAWGIRRGLDGLITDDPALLSRVLDEETEVDSKIKDGRTKDYPHPPTSTSWTGLYIRRWTRLYAVVGGLRTLAWLFNGVIWMRLGSWPAYLDKILGRQRVVGVGQKA